MTKNHLLSVVLALGMPTLLAENPHGFPEYPREITLELKTVEDAAMANLTPVELPIGKKVAFSLRWDDTNPKHIRQLQTFDPYGFKANFYPSGSTPPFFKEILAKGNSLGSHTYNHFDMIYTDMNIAFQEIMEMRQNVECAYGICVNAFVMPGGIDYGYSSTEGGKRIYRILGRSLWRSGHLGGPDGKVNVAEKYGIPEGCWFGSLVFSPGDSNPSPVQFKKILDSYLKTIQEKKLPFGPYITMGVHTWQNDEGFKVLENEIYGKYGGNPDWWYCTATDYYAYRYQYMNTRAQRLSVSGNKVVFRITGCGAYDLGSGIPVHFVCNVPVVKATSSQCQVEVVRTQEIAIGHDDNHGLPQQIGKALSGKKGAWGIDAELLYLPEQKSVSVKLVNGSADALGNLELTIRLPPCFEKEPGVLRMQIASLASEASGEYLFEVGEKSQNPLLCDKDMSFYLQADFLAGKVRKRLFSSCMAKHIPSAKDGLRDHILALGPLPKEITLPEKAAEQWSMPGAALKNLGEIPEAKWHLISFPGLGAMEVNPKPEGSWWSANNGVTTVYVLEFNAPKAQKANLYLWRIMGKVYLNGKETPVQPKNLAQSFDVQKGLNRLLIVLEESFACRRGAISISFTDDILNQVEYHKCSSM